MMVFNNLQRPGPISAPKRSGPHTKLNDLHIKLNGPHTGIYQITNTFLHDALKS